MVRDITRRDHLKIGGVTLAGGLAGCIGVDNGDGDGEGEEGETEFTVSTYFSEDFATMDGVSPSPMWEMVDRLDERSDGEIQMDLVADGQLSDAADGGSKAQANVIQSGDGSVGNSTAFWPENQIFLLPYTFPTRRAYAYAFYHPEIWENYWVPFAQKYNIFPFFNYVPALRQVYVSESGTEQMDGERLTRPDQLEGLSLRRTESRVADVSLSEWGADPVELTWGDTVQGMETGVVDGTETWSNVAVGFGMGEVIDQVVHLDWKSGLQIQWVNTDWLQTVPDDHLEIIADVTRELSEEMVHLSQETIEERVGEQDPVPEGSAWDELDVTVNFPDDDELEMWREPIDPIENPEMWEPEKDLMEELGTPEEDIHGLLYDLAREDGVPDNDEDFSVDAWWDDYLHELA